MITSGDLTRALAEVLGFPEATIATYYRRLREDGLVPKSGRGPRSSMPMTPYTAATLLTAIAGRRFETESVADIIDEFSTVRATKHLAGHVTVSVMDGVEQKETTGSTGRGVWDLGPIHIHSLAALNPNHTITQAIEALIKANLEQEFEVAFKKAFPGQRIRENIQVELYGPVASAGVEISYSLEDGTFFFCEVQYYSEERISSLQLSQAQPDWLENVGANELQSIVRMLNGDLLISRSFGRRTIQNTAALFWDDRWNSMTLEEQYEFYRKSSPAKDEEGTREK